MLYSGAVKRRGMSSPALQRAGGTKESQHVYNETELLNGALELDTDALAQIHDCFYEQIYRYTRYRTGDAQVAEDATSEVFVRLLDALQNGNPPRDSLRGWLFGTASNVVNDHFRRHYRTHNEDLETHTGLEAGAETDPEHQLQTYLTHAQLRKTLSELTPEQQHVITLRFGQGLSHREVAQLMDKSEGAVKLLQLRALRALRRLIKPMTA